MRELQSSEYGRIVEKALVGAGRRDWEVIGGDYWCQVEPSGHLNRLQGWKIHVSARADNAVAVLEAAAGVLVGESCPFKFVVSPDRLARSLSRENDRAFSGKFITAYPDDDEQFVRLLEVLHQATRGLPGPQILSDRRYRDGIVQYRYGSFASVRMLGDNGVHRDMLVAPDGSLVPDLRVAWFAPPPWARDPVVAREEVVADIEPLIGRYRVTGAIRHSNKGGVFRAVAEDTGQRVIIKQGRPHIDVNVHGDVRDLLRNEAEMLTRLTPSGLVPRFVEMFELEDHLFLVEEEIPWRSLQDWVAGAKGGRLPDERVVEVAHAAVELVAEIHRAGVVIRDLTPANVLLSDAGELRLIDLEAATVAGSEAVRLGTPGYAAPETAGEVPPPADQAGDLFGLGAVLAFAALRQDPLLVADDRPTDGRMAAWLKQAASWHPSAGLLAPLICGLMKDDPAARWSLNRARRFLNASAARDAPASAISTPDADAMIRSSLEHLLDTMAPRESWLWPAEPGLDHADPALVQWGAGGGLSALAAAWAVRDQVEVDQGRLLEAMRHGCRWLDRYLDTVSRVIPGLYVGHAGVAWTAWEVATVVGDQRVADRALRLARRLPMRWPIPDVVHGLAGGGLALVHLWRRTGQAELSHRGQILADGLVESAQPIKDAVCWPLTVDVASELEKGSYLGFAHGNAGVGAFLVAAAAAWNRPDYLETAVAAADLLVTTAQIDGEAAWWSDRLDRQDRRLPNWCHGSSGIGTFLLRLWRATGRDVYLDLARKAAVAVREDTARSCPGACHGLAAEGHFLLDLADVLEEEKYRAWAGEHATGLAVRSVERDGRHLIGDASGRQVSAGYAGGLAGSLSFLLRLRHGGARPFMPDGPH
ncbi:class IV lanthionine synthetase LanL [Nonomuraea sp. NPDC003804]|uniref:class IV lanthionine synthetase LanL n=1 Tax=Nonomuraea sp. NPDC003804 TaxID=3154547 RepID=UPI0033AFC65A